MSNRQREEAFRVCVLANGSAILNETSESFAFDGPIEGIVKFTTLIATRLQKFTCFSDRFSSFSAD